MFAGRESCADHAVCKLGAAPPPPLPPSTRENRADHVVCKGGGCTPQPPQALAINDTIMSSPYLQERKVVRIILFANEGGRDTPKPSAAFKAIHVCNKKEASCHHHVCSEGKLCRSFCLQMGGLRPQSRRCFQAAHVCKNKEISCHLQVCSDGRLCGLFCSCLIFSEYIFNQVLIHRFFNDLVIAFQSILLRQGASMSK